MTRSRAEAEREARRIGLKDGAVSWETAVEASMRGWPAWRTAQYLQCSPKLIYDLGGPDAIDELWAAHDKIS